MLTIPDSKICPKSVRSTIFSETCPVQSKNNLKLVRLNLEFVGPKRSTPEKVHNNPKFGHNVEQEIIFVKVNMENLPVESGICPVKTSNSEWVRNNPKFVRNLEPEIIFVKVKMENRQVESEICPILNVKSGIG